MLKRFSVENFASFNDEQSLDLTAGRTELLPEHICEFTKVKLLKSAVIYGANASGKSNLVKALDFAKQIVIKGLTNVDTYKKHFRLMEGNESKQSSFNFEIEIDGDFFCYGFDVLLKSGQLIEEWLYKIGSENPELIFERKGNEIEIGKRLSKGEGKGRFKVYRDDMKNQHSQLFLAEIANKALELPAVETTINAVYAWFKNKLKIIYPDDDLSHMHFIMNSISDNYSKVVGQYLRAFDTGVVDVESIEEDFETGLKHLPDNLKNKIATDLNNKDFKETVFKVNKEFFNVLKAESGELSLKKLGLVHGKQITDTFELKDESDGTRRLLDFIPLIPLFSQDHTVIIDEIDRSLHPMLTRTFFELFHQNEDSKSQLLMTTHESTLLDLELLRRDEIWFVEKDDSGSSSLFPLNKFKVRYDSKVEKAYLLGRYGAIPAFKSFDSFRGGM